MQQIFRQWIGMHRAMIAWYHAAHHVTKGTGFGGDHVNIYGEIYTQLDEDLDMIVEKGIGLTGDETLADPVSSLSLAATMLAQYPMAANQDAEMIACSAFEISKKYITFLEGIYSQFDACGMSLGLDDLLQGLANQYETYVYLLQQRSRGTGMKMTESQLRRTIRKVILSEGPPGYYDYMDDLEYDDDGYLMVFSDRTSSGITSMAGMDRYADHRGLFSVIQEAIGQDREIEGFFEEAVKRASNSDLSDDGVGRSAWMEGYGDLCGYTNVFSVPPKYYGFVFDYIIEDEMSPREFLKKIR